MEYLNESIFSRFKILIAFYLRALPTNNCNTYCDIPKMSSVTIFENIDMSQMRCIAKYGLAK